MKVSRKVYFLLLIIEECAEIIHRTCKAVRFGLDERWKPEDGTNRQLLEGELVDLRAVLDLNVAEGNLSSFNSDPMRVLEKQDRVRHFLKYSEEGCQTITREEGMNAAGVYQLWQSEEEKDRSWPGRL
jgi:hypothetical protein